MHALCTISNYFSLFLYWEMPVSQKIWQDVDYFYALLVGKVQKCFPNSNHLCTAFTPVQALQCGDTKYIQSFKRSVWEFGTIGALLCRLHPPTTTAPWSGDVWIPCVFITAFVCGLLLIAETSIFGESQAVRLSTPERALRESSGFCFATCTPWR